MAIPPNVAQLVVGSTLAGTETPGGEFDEIFLLGRWDESSVLGRFFLRRWPTEVAVAAYYGFTRDQAALGPITEQEEEARLAARAKWFLEKGSGGSPPAMMMAPTGCDSNRLWLEISTTTNTEKGRRGQEGVKKGSRRGQEGVKKGSEMTNGIFRAKAHFPLFMGKGFKGLGFKGLGFVSGGVIVRENR